MAASVGVVLEHGVALLERPGIRPPNIYKPMFHVERRPVHPAPAPEGAVLNQFVHPRINNLDRQSFRQIRKRSGEFAADLGDGRFTPCDLHPQRCRHRGGLGGGAAEHHQARFSLGDQAL